MKGIKIEIPILAIIILIGAILGINYFKNRKIKAQEAITIEVQRKYDSIRIVTAIEKKAFLDSIAIRESQIKDQNLKIQIQKDKVEKSEAKLKEIKAKVNYIPNDTIYSLTKEYLPEPSDSSKFAYSGNQVKEIYTEHLQLIETRQTLIEYSVYTGEMEVSIRKRDEQISDYYDLIKLHEAELMNEATMQMALRDENTQLRKSNKFWKVATPSAGAIGIAIGVLIVL